jgi:hypothetical protein
MRINKTTTVGAVAACAVIGATSPVWADSGSTSGPDATTAQQAAAMSAIKAEVAKLKGELRADEAALHAATKAARAESKALTKARAEAAHWKSVAENTKAKVRTVTVAVPASDPAALNRADRINSRDKGEPCDHRHGDHHFGDGR